MTAEIGRRPQHAAQRYAARGWHIFPLHTADKAPANHHGFRDATDDADIVAVWWGENPNFNIGLAPEPCGLVVVDIDGPDARAHAERFGLLEVRTLSARTGRANGGEHLYFRRPPFAVGNRKLAAGVEPKGGSGYVVPPPSIHPSGVRYRFIDRSAPIAELPARAREALRAAQEPAHEHDTGQERIAPGASGVYRRAPALEKRVAAYIARLPSGMHRGDGRNQVAFQLGAALLRDFALDRPDALAWAEAWNASNTEPLSDRELTEAVSNGARYGSHAYGDKLAWR